MSEDRLATSRGRPPELTDGPHWLIQTGADIVHLVEELHQRLFRLLLLLVGVGSVLSVWFAHLDHRESSGPLTTALAVLSLTGSVLAFRHADRVYLWLRGTRLRQQLPGVIAATLMLVDGPYSPMWWVAFPLLSVMAAVGSTRLTLGWGLAAMLASVGAALLHGASLLPGGDGQYLLAGVSLPLYGLFARGVGEWSGGFVLRLHCLERDLAAPLPPLRVQAVQGRDRTPGVSGDGQPASQAARRTRDPSRLTVRQLEVAMLLRDGLRQPEIARCLGISARQVERLVEEGRRRTNSHTTSELVAKLIEQRLVP